MSQVSLYVLLNMTKGSKTALTCWFYLSQSHVVTSNILSMMSPLLVIEQNSLNCWYYCNVLYRNSQHCWHYCIALFRKSGSTCQGCWHYYIPFLLRKLTNLPTELTLLHCFKEIWNYFNIICMQHWVYMRSQENQLEHMLRE